MKLLKRVGYYLIGVSLGSIVVLFIWKGKDVSFDYGMDARTLKSIRKKKIEYSETVSNQLTNKVIDSASIARALEFGDVDFSKSKARQKPCAEYFVESDSLELYVKRCDSIATIETVRLKY